MTRERRNARILKMRKEGYTLQEIAEKMGCSVWTACQISKLAGAKRGRLVHKPEWYERPEITRDRQIIERRRKGETLTSIGKSLGISRERVRQIVERAAEQDENLRQELARLREPKPKSPGVQEMRRRLFAQGLQACPRCKETKPVGDFCEAFRGVFGSPCRVCNTKHGREYYRSRLSREVLRKNPARRRSVLEQRKRWMSNWLERIKAADPEGWERTVERLREMKRAASRDHYQEIMADPVKAEKRREYWRQQYAQRKTGKEAR